MINDYEKKEYLALTCKDRRTDCSSYTPTQCSLALSKQDCPRTCGSCRPTLFCTDNKFLCQNGGACSNLTSATNADLFGFRCNCPASYTGDLCQTCK